MWHAHSFVLLITGNRTIFIKLLYVYRIAQWVDYYAAMRLNEPQPHTMVCSSHSAEKGDPKDYVLGNPIYRKVLKKKKGGKTMVLEVFVVILGKN